MFLAGDVGGTKTLLAEFQVTDDGLTQVREEAFPSRSHKKFEEILTAFLAGREGPPLQAACFGVAGIVVNGRSQATNLPWFLEERALAEFVGVPRVKLLNDLQATAYGILTLPASRLVTLNPWAAPSPSRAGNIAVIAAGTGLGEAMLHWDGARYHPISSEGGHADFAPGDEEQAELWSFLRAKYGGHISYERVLSGPGVLNVYEFLKARGGFTEPRWLAEELENGDAAAVISGHGLEGDAPLCERTLEIFVSVYGAEAGNLALRTVASGGLFLGGGIAPKILPALQSPAFLDCFTNKGRFTDFLKGLEVSVSLEPKAALLGAAHYAGRL